MILLILLLLTGTAFADTYIGSSYNYTYSKVDSAEKPLTPVGSQYTAKPEPTVTIDRHVLNRNDYESDVSILIAGQRIIPKFEVSEPVAISKEAVVREYIPQANPMADVTVRATIESDDEAPVNYPL